MLTQKKKLIGLLKTQENNWSRRGVFLNWAPSILYMVLIFVFSHKEPLLATVAGAWSFAGLDKIAHFGEFFILFFLLQRTLCLEKYRSPELKALCFSILYCISDELHQSFLPYRDCEIGDILADTAGIVAGFIILIVYRRYRAKGALFNRQLIES